MVENVIKIKSGITINVGASVKIKKHLTEKDIWNPATCSCENGKYEGSIIDDSVITSDEIIEETKTVPTNFDEKKFNILLAFSLITIVLLIAINICYYLIKL